MSISRRTDRGRKSLLSFYQNQQGAIAVLFALTLPAIASFVLMTIDYSRASYSRDILQSALDSATMIAAKSGKKTSQDLKAVADPILIARSSAVGPTISASSYSMGTTAVISSATADIPVTVLNWLGMNTMRITVQSEVLIAGNDLEVSLVLDTTGSMAGTKIADLKDAANNLLDILIKDDQSQHYSKVALIPYSMAVNVGSYASMVRGPLTSGTCTNPGCNFYKFRNSYNNWTTFAASTCVTERAGVTAFTDVAPNSTPLGYNYPAPTNPCISNQVLPLTSDKTLAKAAINSLVAGGSTGGHIGVAWGWYMLSPNFSYLWPVASRPAGYNSPDLIKAAIIMTDGEYNSPYCNGVIADDATLGSGAVADHINCDAPNGSAYTQSLKLCANMKTAGIIVYTVGFSVSSDPSAQALINNCASGPSYVYLPNNGVELKTAFASIANSISGYRFSK